VSSIPVIERLIFSGVLVLLSISSIIGFTIFGCSPGAFITGEAVTINVSIQLSFTSFANSFLSIISTRYFHGIAGAFVVTE
jgi:hypothetical protein